MGISRTATLVDWRMWMVPNLLLACSGALGSGDTASKGGDEAESGEQSTLQEADSPGVNGGLGADGSDTTNPGGCSLDLPGTLTRRLSHIEYQTTIKSLLPDLEIGEVPLTRDPSHHGFENRAELLVPSPLLVEQYGAAAESVGVLVAENLDVVLPCDPGSAEEEIACGEQFLEEFAPKVFRRPLLPDEQSDYLDFFVQERDASGFAAAVQLTVEVLLQSPQFLYRLEFGEAADGQSEIVQLSNHEIASRLSFLLTSSGPDDELFEVAESGVLHSSDVREEQARRLLSEPNAGLMMADYHRQWLDLDRLAEESKDRDVYPAYTDELQASIREETDRFVKRVLWQGDGKLSSFLMSNVAVVNPMLAELYGVEASTEDWSEVELDPTQRAGWLTRANFLASRAHKVNGSPPLRSVFVLEKFICVEPPPPPPDVDLSEPIATGEEAAVTNRQRFEARIEPAACQGCHSVIDTIGYGFEHYDAIGGYRETDNGVAVDATGELKHTDVDGPFTGAVELSQRLADSVTVRQCVAKQWFEYAMGRELSAADQCRFEQLQEEFERADGDIRELLVAWVKSPEFVHLRVETSSNEISSNEIPSTETPTAGAEQ